jgi:hypothetical protein
LPWHLLHSDLMGLVLPSLLPYSRILYNRDTRTQPEPATPRGDSLSQDSD